MQVVTDFTFFLVTHGLYFFFSHVLLFPVTSTRSHLFNQQALFRSGEVGTGRGREVLQEFFVLMPLFSHESSQGVFTRCDFASLAFNTTFLLHSCSFFSVNFTFRPRPHIRGYYFKMFFWASG